jgi:hypothetical protein
MFARPLTRLLAVLTLFLAMAVAQPASAATLTTTASCVYTGPYPSDPVHYAAFSCTAYPSGGTGSYSYYWTLFTWCCGDTYQGNTKTINKGCPWGSHYIFFVDVTDSSGATAHASAGIFCPQSP